MIKPVLLSAMLMSSCLFSACQTVATPNLNPPNTQNTISTSSFDSKRMLAHLNAFQSIAEKNGGNRAVGTAGGQASARYIVEQAKKAGYSAQMLPFENRTKTVGQHIFVEIKGKNIDKAIMVGAHYDSVKTGPGINDNASGVAVLLDYMYLLSQNKDIPAQNIVLAFWDSEEEGVASQNYVKQLNAKQLQNIKAYINLDMVGTKNPEILITDGDRSSINEMEKLFKAQDVEESVYAPLIEGLRQLPTHKEDPALEQSLKAFFESKNLKVREDVTTLTASDTLGFLGKVPVTSIVLLNETMNGDELEFAPCYHKACDTVDLVDGQSLVITGEALLHLVRDLEKK